MREDPPRAWNVIYSILIENMDKKERAKFNSDLFRRPMGAKHRGGDAQDIALQTAAAAYLKQLEQQQRALDSTKESEEVASGESR